jgi:integral membrane protein
LPTVLSSPLHRLRLMGRLEGFTLLALLLVAVPLRHAAGLPMATKIMGPVHGLAFVLYISALIDAVSGGGWTKRESLRAILASIVPLGTFVNDGTIAAKMAQQTAHA